MVTSNPFAIIFYQIHFEISGAFCSPIDPKSHFFQVLIASFLKQLYLSAERSQPIRWAN